MSTLRYGIVGGGFITAFQLRALGAVRGIEVAGLVSRRPPTQFVGVSSASKVSARGGSSARFARWRPFVDVIALFAPNFARVGHVEEVVEAVKAGNRLKGIICEKPLARNMPEARRMIRLVEEAGLQAHLF